VPYRLARAERVFGFSLADPDERLLIWLQLRPGDPAAPGAGRTAVPRRFRFCSGFRDQTVSRGSAAGPCIPGIILGMLTVWEVP